MRRRISSLFMCLVIVTAIFIITTPENSRADNGELITTDSEWEIQARMRYIGRQYSSLVIEARTDNAIYRWGSDGYRSKLFLDEWDNEFTQRYYSELFGTWDSQDAEWHSFGMKCQSGSLELVLDGSAVKTYTPSRPFQPLKAVILRAGWKTTQEVDWVTANAGSYGFSDEFSYLSMAEAFAAGWTVLSEPDMIWVTGSTLVLDDDGIRVGRIERQIEYISDFTFVHLTDVHIGANGADERFKEIIEDINELEPQPKYVFITGDLIDFDFYLPLNMILFDYLLSHFNEDIKVFVTVGNHDYRNLWLNPIIPYCNLNHDDYDGNIFNEFYTYSDGKNNFIFLNSGRDASLELLPLGSGLTTNQIEDLKEEFEYNSYDNHFVFMHHPSLNGDDGDIIDEHDAGTIGKNRLEFITTCRGNVSLVLTGHTHEDKIYYTEFSGNDLVMRRVDSVDKITDNMVPLFIQTRSVGKESIYGYRIVDINGSEVTVFESKKFGRQLEVEGLIEDIKKLNLPEGVENSMISKLQNILESLEKDKGKTAINQLEALINQIEALRGKKIKEEEADSLIAMAQEIIDNLSGE